MKKAVIGMMILALSIGISFAVKDSIYILRFDKGESFNDCSSGITTTLTKEHAKKKYGMKIVWEKGGWVGEMGGIRSVWEGYSKVSVHIFNPSDKEAEINFCIKGAKQEEPNAPSNTHFSLLKLPVGDSDHIIDLTTAMCSDGKSKLDYSRIYIWNFMNKKDEPLTIYVSELQLLK